MPRNDSMLYSGATSVSFAKKAEERKKVASEKRAKLKPSGEIVKAELQKEIDRCLTTKPDEVKQLLGSGIPNALEIHMLAKAMTYDSLVAIQTRLNNMLRDNKD